MWMIRYSCLCCVFLRESALGGGVRGVSTELMILARHAGMYLEKEVTPHGDLTVGI